MKKIIFTLFCILSFFTEKTYACNCNPGGTIEANVHDANVILKVRILSISYSDRLDTINVVIEGDPKNVFSKYWNFYVKIYKAVVEETYKGKMSSDTIRIITGMNAASCGLIMEVNDVFLIYGTTRDYLGFSSVQRHASDGKVIWTNNCTRSMVFLQDDFEEFEELISVITEIERTSYKE
jgi:hypothetical protein